MNMRYYTGLFATAALSLVEPPAIAQTQGPQAAPAADTEVAGTSPNTAASRPPDGADLVFEEVVVTARLREERLRDIPVAGTALDRQTLTALGGLDGTQELLATAPAVHYLNTSTPLNSEVSVRGSSTSRATGADATVGLYRDGSYIAGGSLGGRTLTRMDFFDTERVEILRGPQGALFGRNAVGGAINVITTKPQFESSGRVSVASANNDRYEVQGVFNQALTDNLALRIGADWYDQSGGFEYNPVRDEYLDAQSYAGLRGQLRFRQGNIDATLLADYLELDGPALTFRVALPPSGAFPSGYVQERRTYPHNTPDVVGQELLHTQLTVNLSLDSADIASVTSFRSRASDFRFDNDGVDAATVAALRAAGQLLIPIDSSQESIQRDESDRFMQEIHALGRIGAKTTWLVGGDFTVLDSDFSNIRVRTPTLVNPSPGTNSTSVSNFNSWSLFGALGYDLRDDLSLSLESRYTKDDKSFASDRNDLRTGVSSGPRFRIVDDIAPDNLSYTASLSYRPWTDTLFYGKIGTAYRAGGFNIDLGDARAPVVVQPGYGNETTTTYELGSKFNATPNVFVAATGYLTYTDDVLIQQSNGCAIGSAACPAAPTFFLRNAGQSRAWGLELDANATFELPAGTAVRASLGVARQEGEIIDGPDSGRDLPRNPDWTLSGNINLRHPVGRDLTAFSNLQVSGSYGGVQEISGTPALNDYTLANLRVGLETAAGWTVVLYARNLTDVDYAIFEDSTTQRFNQPRTYGAVLSFAW